LDGRVDGWMGFWVGDKGTELMDAGVPPQT
jgi:hypothetical protein